MELRHLRYFVAVGEEENVTRAAARLHVSQPPLTRQIRDLEDELGFALFERTGKTLRLTGAGRVFLDEARAVLARVATAVATARDAARGGRGTLEIGYAPSPSVGLLPAALLAFQTAAPQVNVQLHDQSSPAMLAGLRDRTLDLAVLMQPPKAALAGLVFAPLKTFALVAAMSPTHPLAAKRRVTVAEVLREPIVLLRREEYADYHALLRRVLGAAYRRLRIAEECDSGMSMIAAIEAGRGVAVTIAALEATAGRRLRFVPLSPPPAPAVLGASWRADETNPAVAKFLASLRAAAERGEAVATSSSASRPVSHSTLKASPR